MKLSDFNYELPPELIAQTPIEPRDHSRLLNLNLSKWTLTETKFYDILDKLSDKDVLVLNKTRVINARLHWVIDDGKIVEIFLHKQISDNTWDCLVYPWKKLKPWKEIHFNLPPLEGNDHKGLPEGDGGMSATIIDRSDSWRIVQFNKWWVEFLKIVEKLWSIPLPPYIKEKLENNERYQTVFNEIEWSVAAPTAWLHFTNELIDKLRQKWVKTEKVLLHVWLGTFKWVETENILDHNMHHEYIELEKDVAERLNEYKKQWKRIISVWTTSIRVLESFANEKWQLEHGSKDTNIFIYPWYKWKFVDWIITNFHLPKSTLLMLVSSFAWTDYIKKAYNYAVDNKFRFFSFWDAMFIEK
jgi:S-adenosylmethionine:tRNA ribosyltransferase-isomerase